MRATRVGTVVGLLALVGCLATGCDGTAPDAAGASPTATGLDGSPSPSPSDLASPGPSDSAAPPPLAGGSGLTTTVTAVTAAQLAHTWRAGCPVGPDALRLVRLRYWGFDGTVHIGTIVVNASVVTDITTVFQTLYEDRFPIRSMRPEDDFNGDDNASMAADNTSGFNCRYAVQSGPSVWSQHAYGLAVDVNTVENPYLFNGQVLPPAGAAYRDRSKVFPGMAVPGGDLVKAFAAVGWQWGGRIAGAPDYQHFSKDGR
jgi:hypothetical protein